MCASVRQTCSCGSMICKNWCYFCSLLFKQRQHCQRFRKDSCVQVWGFALGPLSLSVMSSHTGLLLLPRDVPIAVAGRQATFQWSAPCGQVRAFCITAHWGQWLQIGFHNPKEHLKNIVSHFRAECGLSQIAEREVQLVKPAPWFSVLVRVIGSLSAVGLMSFLTTQSQNRNSAVWIKKASHYVVFLLYGNKVVWWDSAGYETFSSHSAGVWMSFCSQLITVSYIYECVFVWEYCPQPLAVTLGRSQAL